VFYKETVFLSVDEVLSPMQAAGFREYAFKQTIFGGLSETGENEPIKKGYGERSFVVIRAIK
jgi:hypothetical protein